MNVKKWIVFGAMAVAVAVASVWGGSPTFKKFTSAAYTVAVSQTSQSGVPQYSYEAWWAQDIAGLALGAEPTTNQVLAFAMNCDSTAAILVVYDTTTSDMITVAQTTSFDKVVDADPSTGVTNLERFVAVFQVQPVGSLAGGYLTVAGRLHLDSSGCATSVILSQDRDSMDKSMGDQDIAKISPGGGKKLTQRSGQAHFMGVLDVISGSQTNAVLVPNGHLTFANQLS